MLNKDAGFHARYELTNHLGNVLSVVSDRRITNTTNTQYIADVISTTDYYPFGMPSRSVRFPKISYELK